jgi:hypothetical protein
MNSISTGRARRHHHDQSPHALADILKGYDTFTRAAETGALKVVLKT